MSGRSGKPVPANDQVSARLRRQPQRDTSAELRVRRALHRRGLRYRVDLAVLPGTRSRVDIAFTRQRVAVFVDGCFWHGCPEHGTTPKNNSEWWRAKLQANQDRDERIDRQLREAGWEVIRVWEHEDPEEAADRIELAAQRLRRRD